MTTQDFGAKSGRELLETATPASDCPEAKAAYEDAGYSVGGFFGPCPTAEHLDKIKPRDATTSANEQQVLQTLQSTRAATGSDTAEVGE